MNTLGKIIITMVVVGAVQQAVMTVSEAFRPDPRLKTTK